MAVLRFGHLGICVSDMARAVRFYRDGLGFLPMTQVAVKGALADKLLRLRAVDQRTVFLERDNVRLALFAYASPKAVGSGEVREMNRTGFAAIMLRVDDLEATAKACVAAGGAVLEDTRTDYPEFRSKLVFLTDPDGTLVELVEIPGDPYKPFGTPYAG
ncbi:MAG: VOC family protein [Candidatus Methylomirabilis sp.]|nr:VOC family protein [Deltaproteobacteria bacterium]